MQRMIRVTIDWQNQDESWEVYRTTMKVNGVSIRHCLDKAVAKGIKIPCYADREAADLKVGLEAQDVTERGED